MKIDWTCWPLLVVPMVAWLALFCCANPPKPEPLDPLVLSVIEIDRTEVIDLGPLTWPEKEETD